MTCLRFSSAAKLREALLVVLHALVAVGWIPPVEAVVENLILEQQHLANGHFAVLGKRLVSAYRVLADVRGRGYRPD